MFTNDSTSWRRWIVKSWSGTFHKDRSQKAPIWHINSWTSRGPLGCRTNPDRLWQDVVGEAANYTRVDVVLLSKLEAVFTVKGTQQTHFKDVGLGRLRCFQNQFVNLIIWKVNFVSCGVKKNNNNNFLKNKTNAQPGSSLQQSTESATGGNENVLDLMWSFDWRPSFTFSAFFKFVSHDSSSAFNV